jgi:hypothetical protein
MQKLGWETWAACSVLGLSACERTTLVLGQTHLPPEGPTPLTVVVESDTDTTRGANGNFVEHMSTSLQPASWQYQLFQRQPDAGAYLQTLNPYHLHIQALDLAFPLQQETNSQSDWDASELDTMIPPTRAVAPGAMFQVMLPPFITALTQSDQVIPSAADAYADYCAYLVQYFNRGAVEYPKDSGTWIANPNGPQPIYWWSILDNIDKLGLQGAEYAQIYDEAVTRMVAANGDAGTLHFSSFEYGDPEDNLTNFESDLSGFLGTFATQPDVPQPDVVAFHLFAAGSPSATDTDIFDAVTNMTAAVSAAVAEVTDAGSPAQVWVTQNNVNSQTPNGPTTQVDGRGTSMFFAAYRPYVFSQFGKAGNRALFHWDFTAGNIEGGPNPDMDPQNAELDYVSGTPLISYWVDYWLGQMFPVTDTGPATLNILKLKTPGGPDGYVDLDDKVAPAAKVEALAVENAQDGSVVVMLVDFAPTDDGGSSGEPRSFLVDITALGSFALGTVLTIDGSKSVDSNGPMTKADLSNLAAVPISLQGYGVAFLKLVRADAGAGANP